MGTKLFLPLLLGTNREGRESEKVARWLFEKMKTQEDIETAFFDVRDFKLPDNDYGESLKDMFSQYKDAIVKADGLVIVSPEYNHGYSGRLKSILDLLLKEYMHKTVGLVGVSSGPWGGTRGVEALLPVVRELGLVVIKRDLRFPLVSNIFDEKGNMKSEFEELYAPQLQTFFGELIWMAHALKNARNLTPLESSARVKMMK
ncbi:MAG: NAD(P)H-dependent oxidoreductase [Parcubacteria group bacterium]|nr:NAD(P)H-dependent oxidoreductase [Parcubacteria group bacterium]